MAPAFFKTLTAYPSSSYTFPSYDTHPAVFYVLKTNYIYFKIITNNSIIILRNL